MPHLPAALNRLLGNHSGISTWGAARPHVLDEATRERISEHAAADQDAEYRAAVRRIIEQARGPQ